MVHRPNPYADAPSLTISTCKRVLPRSAQSALARTSFAMERCNADVLPMDLPVGPDYVLGPGDSLSIDLWGGLSQRAVS